MSYSWEPEPWSNSPTAPPISLYDYTEEKATLAGSFIGAILHGLLISLFFRCMAALLNFAHRREEGIKWWLVFYTLAMFSFVTVYTGMNLYIQSISFIDNRQDVPAYSPRASGPLNYQHNFRQTSLGLIPNTMFNLNNWLADGFLIYRCYTIYSTNLWAITLPCCMYLASTGIGIAILSFQNKGIDTTLVFSSLGIPYLTISVLLNVLLTLMIVIRIVLHDRKRRAATGSPVGISELYKAASTMLIESCALFAVSSLVVVGSLVEAADHSRSAVATVDFSFPILAEIQAIAPLLIIQRVANGSALTSEAITTGHTSSFNVRSRGELAGSECVPLSGYLTSSAAGYRKNPGEPGVVVDSTHPDCNI